MGIYKQLRSDLRSLLSLLTPDMLAHITPRGISVLPGPVVKLEQLDS